MTGLTVSRLMFVCAVIGYVLGAVRSPVDFRGAVVFFLIAGVLFIVAFLAKP